MAKANLENLVFKISNLENKIFKIFKICFGHRPKPSPHVNLENLENLENLDFGGDLFFLLSWLATAPSSDVSNIVILDVSDELSLPRCSKPR